MELTFMTQIEEGERLMSQGDPEGARRVFEAILKEEPTHPLALNDLGAVYHGLGRLDEAACCFELSLAVEPRNENAVINLFSTYVDQLRLEDATGLVTAYHGQLSPETLDEMLGEVDRLRAAAGRISTPERLSA